MKNEVENAGKNEGKKNEKRRLTFLWCFRKNCMKMLILSVENEALKSVKYEEYSIQQNPVAKFILLLRKDHKISKDEQN